MSDIQKQIDRLRDYTRKHSDQRVRNGIDGAFVTVGTVELSGYADTISRLREERNRADAAADLMARHDQALPATVETGQPLD